MLSYRLFTKGFARSCAKNVTNKSDRLTGLNCFASRKIFSKQTTFRISKSIAPIILQSSSYCTNIDNQINQEKSPNKFNIKLKLAVLPKNEDPAVTRSTPQNTNQTLFTNNIDNTSYMNSSKLKTIPLASFEMFSKKNRPLHSSTGQVLNFSTSSKSLDPTNEEAKHKKGNVNIALPAPQSKAAEALEASTSAVNWAIGCNVIAMLIKFGAFSMTGSGSMLSEGIHSLADIANQTLLAIGIKRSQRGPTKEYPYGYASERFIWALISAVGIFFLGCGASLYHGISTLLDPHTLESLPLAFSVLGVSAILESISLAAAIKAIYMSAKATNMSFWGYVKNGPDPMGVAVLLEDSAAVFGLFIAASCLALSYVLENPIFDAVGSILIGVLLGCVAVFLIRKNTMSLLGRTIPSDKHTLFMSILEKDPVVRAVIDAKAITMGADTMRFVADIEWNGREVGRKYLQNVNLTEVLPTIKDEKGLEEFLLQYSESVVAQIGDEVDRLELTIQNEIPEARYVDIETS